MIQNDSISCQFHYFMALCSALHTFRPPFPRLPPCRRPLYTKYHSAGPNNILEKMYLEALCQTQIPHYGCAILSVIQFQHYSEYPVELEKGPSNHREGPYLLLLGAFSVIIFSNFRKAFVESSSAQTIQIQRPPLRG